MLMTYPAFGWGSTEVPVRTPEQNSGQQVKRNSSSYNDDSSGFWSDFQIRLKAGAGVTESIHNRPTLFTVNDNNYYYLF